MQALGLIEVRGLLAAIECADIMLKTAQVELVGKTMVGGGLVAIIVTGDVGAVKAAVEAGATAVKKIRRESLISQHVIPRPHSDIESLIIPESSVKEAESSAEVDDSLAEEDDSLAEKNESLPNSTERLTFKDSHKERVDACVKEFGLEKAVEALKSLPVVKLRNLAREYKDLDITGRAISKANKDLLIEKLTGFYERGN
jgi:ethanolamine utilization protein EutM